MTTITKERLLAAIRDPGFPDTAFLAEAIGSDAYRETFDECLRDAQRQFDDLAAMPASEASFASVVRPYHAIGEEAGMLWSFLDNYQKTDGNDRTKELIEHCQPLIVRFSDHVLLHAPFFHLLQTVSDNEAGTLDPEDARSLELLLRDRKIAGVHLPADKKERLRAINERLTVLQEQFGRNCVESRKIFFHRFDTETQLGEMPKQDKDSAAAEAKDRGTDGWVFTLSPPSRLAVMRYVPDRDVRRLFMEEAMAVGTRPPHDNRPLILEILRLRGEKATILGRKDYADYMLQTRMASDAENVRAMYASLEGPYRKKAERDIAELKESAGIPDLQMWDTSFYANRLSRQKFSIDDSILQKYFEVESTIDGLFRICKTLFGIEMLPVRVGTYAADVRTYEVRRNGSSIGYFLLDLFARPTKRAGAWCEQLRAARELPDGTRLLPVVTNVCNFLKGVDGSPTCLSHYDAITLFHEFGHALHCLLGSNRHPNTSGFSVEWDFVELPSQLMENWCWHTDALALFARHLDSGEAIPDSILAALKKKRTFMTGYDGMQQLEYGSLDLALHTTPVPADAAQLDSFAVAHEREWQVLPVPDFYAMHASFGHIFEGGYAVGYYSYAWAEMLEADVFERFEREGVLHPEAGESYRSGILARGASRPGAELYRSFMGRDVDPGALLRKKGVF